VKRFLWTPSLFVVPVVFAAVAFAQSQNQARPAKLLIDPQAQRHILQQSQLDDAFTNFEKENARTANKARQQAIKDDTAELLLMANELQAYVDKTNENMVSLEVVKKAEQIEKLARSVKEKMKANY
jgi:hypothetical protein